MTDEILLFILDYFLHFYPPPLPAQKIKIKKNLHMCTRNYDQMMYGY